MKIFTKLWLGVIALAILSPLGLILPAYFKSNSAWGEWSAGELQKLLGYLPQGLGKLSGIWNAPLPDYALKSSSSKGLPHQGFDYIISAVAGIVIVVLIVWLIGRILFKKGE